MRRRSRRVILVALVLPGVLTLLTLAVMLWLLPQAPDSIVMQWSGDGASRSAPPSELLLMPVIAMATSVLIWVVGPMGTPRDARGALVTGGCVNTFMNSVAIAVLVGQLSGEADASLPVIAIGVSLPPAGVVGLFIFFATREEIR